MRREPSVSAVERLSDEAIGDSSHAAIPSALWPSGVAAEASAMAGELQVGVAGARSGEPPGMARPDVTSGEDTAVSGAAGAGRGGPMGLASGELGGASAVESGVASDSGLTSPALLCKPGLIFGRSR